MKTKEIKILLDSFYNGETSQREELLLREYFNSAEVAEELLDEKEIFLQLGEAESIVVPPVLEGKLNMLIDNLAKQESLEEKKSTKHLLMWASAAASVAILLFAGIYMSNLSLKGDYSTIAGTQEEQAANVAQFTEAEYVQAENAMRMLSANFNKGMEQLDEMNNKLEQTNNVLNKTFKKIDSYEN